LDLLRSHALPVTLYFLMPLAILAFVEGGFDLLLQIQDPAADYSGADLAASGQATMFGFMSLATIGFVFLGDHGWGTWNRVRSLGVRPWQVMTGKLGTAYLNQLAIFVFVMVMATVLFDLRVRGPVLALLAVELLMAAVAVGYCFIACAVCTNQAQFNAFAYLGALVLAGLGGALTPFETLPGWAQAIAPAVPTYWSVRAFGAVILDGAGISDVATELVVMALFAAGFFLLGAWLFDGNKKRSTWA
ncbi:MAG: ABC transporter permease, partial [Actinobacteria bacterium]|nr:ABC transporter permease [Actinomycetota bacterium]